ncbi:MAG: DUF1127 domain-containing protein [Paracoccaceae bacterium]
MAHVNTATHPGFLMWLYSGWAENKLEQYRRALYTRTVRELENLSDQQLDDIGIDRTDIHRKAYASVYQNAPYAASIH